MRKKLRINSEDLSVVFSRSEEGLRNRYSRTYIYTGGTIRETRIQPPHIPHVWTNVRASAKRSALSARGRHGYFEMYYPRAVRNLSSHFDAYVCMFWYYKTRLNHGRYRGLKPPDRFSSARVVIVKELLALSTLPLPPPGALFRDSRA